MRRLPLFLKFLGALAPVSQTTGQNAVAQSPHWIIRLLCIPLSLVLSACSTHHAYRQASLAWDSNFGRPKDCDNDYAFTDDLIATEFALVVDRNDDKHLKASTQASRKKLDSEIKKLVYKEAADTPGSTCWRTSYENHQALPAASHDSDLHRRHELQSDDRTTLLKAPGYDLFFAEFDDQGERTDVAHDHVPFEKSQVALIESRLGSMLKEETEANAEGGLNIVLFTHGWHGNASASNEYSTWFKAILEQIAFLERTSRRATCSSKSQRAINPAADTSATPACTTGVSTKERRTVGIEIAWRGDSIDIPYLNNLDFWDRKGAAQTAARGGVSDLMARLQRFYLSHSCRVTPGSAITTRDEVSSAPVATTAKCDSVHLLTVGHSFGALIDYHSLSNNLGSGVLTDERGRAYGFGDMTILLNPAFEGERETTLIETSIHHLPFPNEKSALQSEQIQRHGAWPSGAQMPTLVTLQSEGDWATHYAFPAVRLLTGVLENTSGENEFRRSIQASGWVWDYYTHRLTTVSESGSDTCTGQERSLDWYCPFDIESTLKVVHPLHLCKPALHDRDPACDKSGLTQFPPFDPFWTVRVDKAIMKDHDDIADPAVVRFIALLFRAAYMQEEIMSAAILEN